MLAKNNNVHISDDGIEAQDDNLERKESCEHRFIGWFGSPLSKYFFSFFATKQTTSPSMCRYTRALHSLSSSSVTRESSLVYFASLHGKRFFARKLARLKWGKIYPEPFGQKGTLSAQATMSSIEAAFSFCQHQKNGLWSIHGRKSANHGLPARLRTLRNLKQQWLSMVTKMDLHCDCA